MIVMLGFWGVLAAAGVHLYRSWVRGGAGAESLLARRFASGEISESEYEDRLDALRVAARARWTSRI